MGVNLALRGNQGSSPGDANLDDDEDNETSFFGSIKQNGQVQLVDKKKKKQYEKRRLFKETEEEEDDDFVNEGANDLFNENPTTAAITPVARINTIDYGLQQAVQSPRSEGLVPDQDIQATFQKAPLLYNQSKITLGNN